MATLILNPDATLETMATLVVGHNISDAATPENTSVTPAKKKKKKKKKKKGGSGSLPFSIVKKEGRGRCVIANHDLPVGFELFCERPFASVSLDASSCSFCFQQLRPGKCVFHCPSCDDDNKQVVQYCCKECVLCDADAHSMECRLLPDIRQIAIVKDVDELLLRLIMRIFSKHYICTKVAAAASHTQEQIRRHPFVAYEFKNKELLFTNYDEVICMIDHSEKVEDSWKSAVQEGLVAIRERIDFDETFQQMFDLEVAFRLACKINSNAHGIANRSVVPEFNDEGKVITFQENADYTAGLGMFPNLALLNHSCDPNVLYFGELGFNRVKTSRAISAGEELCVTYIDTYQSRDMRQGELLRTKYFQCTCTRCEQVGDTVDDVISGLCCSQCGESGRLVEPELAAEIRAKRALELEASFAALGEFEEERPPTKSNLKQKQKKMKEKSCAAAKSRESQAGNLECVVCSRMVPYKNVDQLDQKIKDRTYRGDSMYNQKNYTDARKYYESIVEDLTSAAPKRANTHAGDNRCLLHHRHHSVSAILPKLMNCCRFMKDYVSVLKYSGMIVDGMQLVYPELNLEQSSYRMYRTEMFIALNTDIANQRAKLPAKTLQAFRNTAKENIERVISARTLIFGAEHIFTKFAVYVLMQLQGKELTEITKSVKNAVSARYVELLE